MITDRRPVFDGDQEIVSFFIVDFEYLNAGLTLDETWFDPGEIRLQWLFSSKLRQGVAE